ERPQGAEGVHVLQGTGLPRGGDVAVRDVLQLRVDAADAACAGAVAAAAVSLPDAGDGGGANGPQIEHCRPTQLPPLPPPATPGRRRTRAAGCRKAGWRIASPPETAAGRPGVCCM